MSNKATGSQFEKRFAAILSHNRFWVHIFQDNCNGQPCDVMAARDGETYLFDCKNCEKERFLLSRMEENQLNAMELFYMTGNKRGMFVIQFPAGPIYLVDYSVLRTLRDYGIKKIGPEEIQQYGRTLENWLEELAPDGGEWNAGHNWQ